MSALKQSAREASPSAEFEVGDDRRAFITPSAAELQERLIETLEIVDDWKAELNQKQARMLLREELIGVEQEEVDQLKAEFGELARCMQILAWRPHEVKP